MYSALYNAYNNALTKDKFRCLIALFSISTFLISTFALFAEYVLHIPACKLCHYQRIPYYSIFSVSLIYWLLYIIVKSYINRHKQQNNPQTRKRKSLEKQNGNILQKTSLFIVVFSLLCFGAGILLSIYHILVIYGFVTASCSSISKSTLENIKTRDELYDIIFHNNEVPCNIVTSEIFGIPFAFWNLITSIFFIIVSMTIIIKYSNRKK